MVAGACHAQTAEPPSEAVVAAHGATVLRVIRAILGPADADDAWFDTFLAAMTAYPNLPADANTEAWLVTIAHRKAFDIIRAAGRRPLAADGIARLRSSYPVPDDSDVHPRSLA